MGLGSSSPWYQAFGSSQCGFLMLGLDAAGKSTILHKLDLGDVKTSIPTIGFNIETVEHGKLCFTAWDCGGRDKIRPLWRHYFQGIAGLIFVIDSCDSDRLDDTRDELVKLLNEDDVKSLPLLVFANKQDSPFAINPEVLIESLRLPQQTNRRWHLQPTSAILGIGLYEGLTWLASTIRSKQTDVLLRFVPEPVAAVSTPGRYTVLDGSLPVFAARPVYDHRQQTISTLESGTSVGVAEVVATSSLGGCIVRIESPLEGWCAAVAGSLRLCEDFIVSLQVSTSGGLHCTNLAGEELLSMDMEELQKGVTLRELCTDIALRLNKSVANLKLVMPNGQLASEVDSTVSVFDAVKQSNQQ